MIIKINTILPIMIIIIALCAMPGFFNFAFALPIILFLLYYLIIFNRKSYRFFKYTIKNSLTFKLFLMTICWMLISYLFNFATNNYSFIHFVYTYFFGYLLNFIFCFVIGLLVSRYIKTEIFIKIIISIVFIILFFALIEIIMFKYHIPGLEYIISLSSGRPIESVLGYKYEGFPRIQSLFNEPAHFAWFLTCNIPIIITIFKTKYKIFSNILINKLIKFSIIPLWIISLIYTQSAIFLIFSVIILLIYSLKMIKNNKFLFLVVCTILLIIILLLTTGFIDFSDTYLRRVINTVKSFGDFQTFAMVEPSLATRIVHWVNMFIVFLHHPIFGVSCGNLNNFFPEQLVHSPLPYTQEIIRADILAKVPRPVLPSIFFRTLVDTGIVGTLLFYSFLLKIYNNLKRLNKKLECISNDFFNAIQQIVIIYICLTFYDSQLYCHYFWIIFGYVVGLYMQLKYINERD